MATTTLQKRAVQATPSRRSVSDRFLELFINPAKSNHLAGLDTIRGIAVLFVVVYHCWALSNTPRFIVAANVLGDFGSLYRFIAGMGLGVDIFFVLSGFLLSLPWHKAYYRHTSTPRFSVYIRRRLQRIVPPYWFMLGIVLLLWTNLLVGWEGVVSRVGVFNVFMHLIFMQELLPISSSSFGVNGALWTLTLEMTFYLVLPFFVHLFVGRRWIAGMALTLGGSLVYLYLVRYSLEPIVSAYTSTVAIYGVPESAIRVFLSHQFLGYLPEFGLGMSLANYWIFRDMYPRHVWVSLLRSEAACVVATALGLLVLAFSLYHVLDIEHSDFYYLTNSILAAAGCALLILGCQATSPVLQTIFRFLPLRFFGVIGYSVFLWHFPLIVNAERYPILANMTPLMRFVTILLIISPLVLIAGSVLFLFIEKPFIENRDSIEKAQAQVESLPTTPIPRSTASKNPLPVLLRLPREATWSSTLTTQDEVPTLRTPAIAPSQRQAQPPPRL